MALLDLVQRRVIGLNPGIVDQLKRAGAFVAVVQDGIKDRAGLERKLAITSFNVDPNRAHIRIIDHDVCLQCERQQCVNCCPAACYTPQPDGRVIFSYEGCVECGTCRIVCNEFDNIEWTYPTGGFGVQYRFG